MIKGYLNSTAIILMLLSVFILFTSMSGCRKECRTKSLGELNCNPGFIAVSETKYSGKYYAWGYPNNEVVVINDSITYKNSFPYHPGSMPFGYIDFDIKSLVVVKLRYDPGSGVQTQGCLCYNPSSKNYLFKIEYSISNQCKGSGISSGDILASIICPKLPSDASIELDARNINPF